MKFLNSISHNKAFLLTIYLVMILLLGVMFYTSYNLQKKSEKMKHAFQAMGYGCNDFIAPEYDFMYNSLRPSDKNCLPCMANPQKLRSIIKKELECAESTDTLMNSILYKISALSTAQQVNIIVKTVKYFQSWIIHINDSDEKFSLSFITTINNGMLVTFEFSTNDNKGISNISGLCELFKYVFYNMGQEEMTQLLK